MLGCCSKCAPPPHPPPESTCEPEEGWYGQPKYCYKKQYTLFLISFAVAFGLLVLVLYILADLISSLEIQRLQLAGSSSTVFAVNLILYYCVCPLKYHVIFKFSWDLETLLNPG